MNIDNPFGKVESVSIGKEVAWDIDKASRKASKTAEHKGTYYRLEYDNTQIVVQMSSDAAGNQPKSFTQLEVKNLSIDGKSSPLFMWCLNNQARHNRFLQQGLTVKKDICNVDGGAGRFIMKLNKATLQALLDSKRLAIELKPYRTPLELKYDMSDFRDMNLALNAKPAPAKKAKVAEQVAAKKCWAGPPAAYKKIKSVEYDCNDAAAKKDAEAWVSKLVLKEKENEKKLAAERERQRKLADEKKKKEMEARLALEKQQAAEAAAIAASQAKQAEIGSEITQKMVNVCSKFWDKGEHRCYCQKYIEYAPAEIQANSSCN